MCYAMTYFFFYFCMGVFLSVLSIYLTTIGKTTSEMTFIVSASSLFGIVMIPIVGFFNDRVQKPRVLAAALLAVVVVFGVLFAVSKSTWALYVLDGLIMGPWFRRLVRCVSVWRVAGATVTVWYAAGAPLAMLWPRRSQLLFWILPIRV